MGNTPLIILSIDDDLDCRRATARFLTCVGGHMVEVAKDGREGLKKAAELKPDIILLDMRMPDMSGVEVMEALCANSATRDIPVIIITGASLNDTEQNSLSHKRNFVSLEQKPADLNKVLRTIEATLHGMITPEKREAVSGDSQKPARPGGATL